MFRFLQASLSVLNALGGRSLIECNAQATHELPRTHRPAFPASDGRQPNRSWNASGRKDHAAPLGSPSMAKLELFQRVMR
jgi:hypothetical protein